MSRGPSYSWSSLTTAEVQQWADLENLLAMVDGTGEYYTAEDLAEELEFPNANPALDTWAVRDGSGMLVAFGHVFFRDALVDGAASADSAAGVHPDHRRLGIGTELRRRMEQRARTANATLHPGVPLVLRADVGVQVLDARELLAEQGFVESRYFHEMEHDLAVVPSMDDRSGIRRYHLGPDDNAVLEAHTQAFATHWRSAPWSAQEWTSHIVEARSFRPALSFVHVDGSGAIDGYVLSHEYVDGEVWVNLLGVLEHARARGTGAALLRAVLMAGKAAGYRIVGLGVDSDNSTGAGRLYESAGFKKARTTVACLKTLDPLAASKVE